MLLRPVSLVLLATLSLALTAVYPCQSAREKYHGPISGRVTARDGTPVKGVMVSSQQEYATTDKIGAFRIEHPGAVLHFLTDVAFQPQTLIVTPEMYTVNVVLEPASASLSLSACAEPRRGFDRIGWGEYGLQFDVPRHDVKLIRGKADVDYVVHTIKAKSGDDRLELWFGPYAMSSTPDDEQFVESRMFTTRNVVMQSGLVRGSEGGVIGTDTSGHLQDGGIWRQMAIVGEGARYQNVSPENAELFDSIINSACWNPQANETVR